MRDTDVITRIITIKQYVDHTQIGDPEGYQVTTKELLALSEYTRQDLLGAVLLAFTYGRAKGYQLAKGGAQE